jgi:hypothetical protein
MTITSNDSAAPGNGSLADAAILGDPYVQLVLRHVSDPALFDDTPERTKARHAELLLPFLTFFLRHDRDGYYHALYRRKGLLDATGTAPRADVKLHDLAKLRIHSDDLRGENGQGPRLIREVTRGAPGSFVFSSSGTSQNADGPVSILRSAAQMQVTHTAMGRQMEWMVGHSLAGSCAMIQAAPEMVPILGMAGIPYECFRHRDVEVVMGARLREDANEPSIWRRIEPDFAQMGRFFASPKRGKVLLTGAPALHALASSPEFHRHLNPGAPAGAPFLDFGEDGVLMTGGGLKRLPTYRSMREMLIAVDPALRARRDGELVPVPVVDLLGLTECVSAFGNRAGNPADDSTWIKSPHPLTWVGMLESPRRLQPVSDDELGQSRLLFYVNFHCIDYLEAIVSGDLVKRTPAPGTSQHGFVYERRAEESEGFQIREGCG